MTMCCLNRVFWFILPVFLVIGSSLHSQENLTAYWQPSIALNYKVTKTYAHHFSVQNRNYVFDDEVVELSVRQLDVTHFSSLKLQDNQSVALGMLYRFRETFDGGSNELRLTQQYNITSRPFVVRYGQRFRAEQRITRTKTTHRFRYRLSLDFPLIGQKLDIGEPYLVTNAESLLSVAQGSQPQYDARLTVNLGWKLSKNTKVQLGMEYRSEDFSQELEQVLFFLSTCTISL